MRILSRRLGAIERQLPDRTREQQLDAYLRRLLGCSADQLQDHELDAAELFFRALAEDDPDGRGEIDLVELRRAVFAGSRS